MKLMQKNTFAANLSLIILGSFIAFLLGELIVRAMENYQYVKSENRVQFDQYKKIYSDEREKEYVFGHQANVRVRLEKGYYNFTFITNSEGLREKKDHSFIEKSVIFLGDSIVEGASVENEETMDEIFERITGITSLNFGVGSSNTVHEYYWLKSKYRGYYNTKLIVLGFCLNDFSQNILLRCFDANTGNWKLYKYLDNSKSYEIRMSFSNHVEKLWENIRNALRRSRLITFIYRALKNFTQSSNNYLPPFRYDQVDEKSKFYTEQYINKIRAFAHNIGAELVVVIFPQESQLTWQYDANMRMQDALIRILKKNKVSCIDLYHVIKKEYLTKPHIRWYHDDTHPYKDGHRLIGEYLAHELPVMFPNLFEQPEPGRVHSMHHQRHTYSSECMNDKTS